MAIEDAIRELTEAVKGSDESPESEVTYIEAPANPSDGDTLTYDATSGKWVAGAPQSGGMQLYGPYYLCGEIAQSIAYGSGEVGHITSIEAIAGYPVNTTVLQDGDFFVPVSEDYSQILPPIKKDLYYYEIEGSEYGSLSITVLNTIDQYTIEQGASFNILALCSRELPLSE